VIFDKLEGYAETDVVENARETLNGLLDSGDFRLPAGVSYEFTGNYENQVRATRRLLIVVPISLILIFLILYFQFKSVISTSLIFSGIVVALSGGFIMLWLYGQPWFLDGSLAGIGFRELFQVHTIHLSVAVWVGFIALFGVATDDGVLISTYIKQLMASKKPESVTELRALILEAGSKRVRPAMMTTATTLIALLPVLTSTGKGSDIMVPMAIPLFGGMAIEVLTMFVVPVLYSLWQEGLMKREHRTLKSSTHEES
jgi:Cu(I)/Ag(I) efflux system membrane protein CusA/SilA